MATTTFFRGLGGAVGAAVLGAVFAARSGGGVGRARVHELSGAARADLIDAVQAVFLCAAPLAALGAGRPLLLRETPLREGRRAGTHHTTGDGMTPQRRSTSARSDSGDAISVIEVRSDAPFDGPPLHHHDFDEAF